MQMNLSLYVLFIYNYRSIDKKIESNHFAVFYNLDHITKEEDSDIQEDKIVLWKKVQ